MERPMSTASRDRVFQKTVQEYIRTLDKPRTPISRLKTVKAKDGSVTVTVHSSRPNTLRSESGDIANAIKEQIGGERTVNLEVIAEARAVAKFVRVSPRKARLVIDAIKGKRVSEALAVLQFTRKMAAEPITKVLASAAANAQDGWGAIPEELKIANFIADGGPTLKRVQPRAQGRAYRILKRTSHLTVVLTDMPAPVQRRRPQGKKTNTPAARPQVAPPVAPVVEQTAPATVEPEQTTAPVKVAAEQTAPEQTAQAAEPSTTPEPEEATPVTASDAPEERSGAETSIEGQGEAEPNQE